MAKTGAAGDGKSERPSSLKRAPRPAADEDVDPVDPISEPVPAPPTGKKRGPYNVQRVDKKPASFRLPPDVLDYIAQARNEAAARGDRLTNDEAVTMAVRAFWGKKRKRRS